MTEPALDDPQPHDPPAEVAGTAPRLAPPPDLPAWNGTPAISAVAVASLATALVGIPVVSIVLGVIARREITASGGRVRGARIAAAGIVLGTLSLVAMTLIGLIAVWAFSGSDGAADRHSPGPAQETSRRVLATVPDLQGAVQQVAYAVEACAVSHPTGSYAGCAPATLEVPADLRRSLLRCGTPGGACLVVAPAGDAYSVTVRGELALEGVSFTEAHTASGAVTKTCGGDPAACPSGTWT